MPAGSGADTSLVDIGYIDEDINGAGTWGTTPASPAFQLVRVTGESLTSDKGTASPEEIRADRQVPDLVETSRGVSGDLNGVLSYGEYDDFFAASMGSSWSSVVSNTISDGTFTASGSTLTGTNVGTGVNVGDIIRITTSASNDGFYAVTAAAAGSLTLSPTVTNEGTADAPAVVTTTRLGMGSTCQAYSIIKRFTDLADGTSGKHVLYKGCIPGGFSLSVNAEGFVEVTFNFLGRETTSTDETLPGSATFVAVGANDVMSAVSGIGTVYDNNIALTEGLTSLSVNVNGNLRTKPQIGSVYPYGIGAGTFNVDGTLGAYFTNDTLLTKMLNNTATSLWFYASDGGTTAPEDGNAYAWHVHRLKYASAGPSASGPNSDVTQDVNFTGIYDSTTTYAISMFRFAA